MTACAPGPVEPSGLPAGVTVELRQSRADVAARQAMVSVSNGSRLPLEVGEVSVADPRFSEPAERVVDRTSSIAAGATVDIRVQLARVACDVGDDAPATLTIAYRQDGRAGSAHVPVVDAVPFVAELHERECVEQRAQRSAAIELGEFTPSPPGEPAGLQLVVTPREGSGDLRVTGIRETNLLTFDGVAEGVHRLDLDQTGAHRLPEAVELPLLPLRCDPHAVQEDKRGTVFRLFVEIGGQEGSFDVAASPELRGEILGWIADWCGFGG